MNLTETSSFVVLGKCSPNSALYSLYWKQMARKIGQAIMISLSSVALGYARNSYKSSQSLLAQFFKITLCYIYNFDSESHELVSWMRGHDSSIHSISIHASGRYALTSSNSVAQLWDLDTFSRKRTLNGAQTVGIQQVWIYVN